MSKEKVEGQLRISRRAFLRFGVNGVGILTGSVINSYFNRQLEVTAYDRGYTDGTLNSKRSRYERSTATETLQFGSMLGGVIAGASLIGILFGKTEN